MTATTAAARRRLLACLFAATFATVARGAVNAQSASPSSCNVTVDDEERAWREFNSAREPMRDAFAKSTVAEWNYNTNLTDFNQKIQLASQAVMANFTQAQAKAFKEAFPCWRSFRNETLKIALRKVTDSGYSALSPEKFSRFSTLQSNMETLYSTAKVCMDGTKPSELEPDLTQIMAKSRNYSELLWAWKGWHDATGPGMRQDYAQFVQLLNESAIANGYSNMAEQWQSDFQYETGNESAPYDFVNDIERLYNQLRPLYDNLHYYVRNKLKDFYGEKNFPSSSHIPAHLLGNMWAQGWQNIMDLVRPYNVSSTVDITRALQNKTVRDLFHISEEFFTSLGLAPMPSEFWSRSMLEKPADRDVVCHASAWNFFNGSDVRIKMCTDRTMNDFITIHHEMGHIQYYLQYLDLHPAFQEGANSGFHEAIGDVLALSVATPKHLREIGLLESSVPDNNESDINFLMSMALEKIAFLPFAKLMDDWRWSVFRGYTPVSDYNKKWWELRCKYQGVSPPVARDENSFDPGAKYHIPANVPYVRYFVSHILQFQFHRALCQAAGQTGPLHRCDIYKSREAGTRLGNMMMLGSSRPWPDALQQLTGNRTMDGSAVIEYFKPLVDWLITQNGGSQTRQDTGCPAAPTLSVPSGVCTNPSPTPTEKNGSTRSFNVVGSFLHSLAMFMASVGIILTRHEWPSLC